MSRQAILAAAAALGLTLLSPHGSVRADDDDDDSKGEPEGLDTKSIERIGIDQLIGVTVRTAPKLARAQADADAAKGDAQAARGVDDWQLTLSATTARQTNAPVRGQPVQVTANEQYEVRGGLRRNLPTGGEFNVRLDTVRLKEEHRIEQGSAAMEERTSESKATRATAEVSLTHPLLRGLGRSVARADRKKAENSANASILRAQVDAGELLRDVIDGYWELVHAAMSLEVRVSSLEAAEKHLKETRIAVRKGDRAKTDLRAAEYAVATSEEGVLNAEIAVRERALSLRQIAGLEIGPDAIALWPSDLPDVGKKRFPLAKLVRRGLARNPALKAIALDGENATIDVRVAKNSKRPRLDVTVAAGAVGTGSNFDNAVRSLGESDTQAEYKVSAGLSFSLDIGNNLAKGNYKSARARRLSAKISVEELRREISSSIVLSVHRIRAARKRAQVAGKAAELAVANLQAERARFAAGRSSSREIYERQGEIDDAKLSRARALADYHQAVVRLSSLTGEILDDYGVEVIE